MEAAHEEQYFRKLVETRLVLYWFILREIIYFVYVDYWYSGVHEFYNIVWLYVTCVMCVKCACVCVFMLFVIEGWCKTAPLSLCARTCCWQQSEQLKALHDHLHDEIKYHEKEIKEHEVRVIELSIKNIAHGHVLGVLRVHARASINVCVICRKTWNDTRRN